MAFLAQNNYEKGEEYIAEAIKRTKKYASQQVQQFNEATLLITQARYEEAFALTEELDQKIEDRSSLLDGYNTLRLTFLASKLGKSDVAKASVEKLRNHSCYGQIKPQFEQGLFSLDDYLSILIN